MRRTSSGSKWTISLAVLGIFKLSSGPDLVAEVARAPIVLPSMEAQAPLSYRELRSGLEEHLAEFGAPDPGVIAEGFVGAIRTQYAENGRRSTFPPPLSMAALLDLEEPEDRYHIEGLIEPDSNVLIAAAPKSHKTNLLLHLGIAGAAGRSALGAFPVPTPLRVGLVLMEDQANRVKRRVERIALSEGVDPAKLEGRLHLWFRPPLQLGNLEAIRDLGDFARSLELDVLFVDSFAYVSAGDSNSADEVTPQLTALSSLRSRRPGLAVGLVVHAGKHQENRGDRVTDIIRGSGAFGAWFDSALLLMRTNEAAPVSVRVEHRDLPSPEPFTFTVQDEFPGPPPRGYLRIRKSEKSAEQILREEVAERLAPDLKARLREHPAGVSRRGLRSLLDEPHRDVEAAFEHLRDRGETELDPAPGKGKAATYRLTVTGVT